MGWQHVFMKLFSPSALSLFLFLFFSLKWQCIALFNWEHIFFFNGKQRKIVVWLWQTRTNNTEKLKKKKKKFWVNERKKKFLSCKINATNSESSEWLLSYYAYHTWVVLNWNVVHIELNIIYFFYYFSLSFSFSCWNEKNRTLI